MRNRILKWGSLIVGAGIEGLIADVLMPEGLFYRDEQNGTHPNFEVFLSTAKSGPTAQDILVILNKII
jgi:hypothetical protein